MWSRAVFDALLLLDNNNYTLYFTETLGAQSA